MMYINYPGMTLKDLTELVDQLNKSDVHPDCWIMVPWRRVGSINDPEPRQVLSARLSHGGRCLTLDYVDGEVRSMQEAEHKSATSRPPSSRSGASE